MKDRIAHIMRAKNLKASDFAELLGIQPSGISHILSGRNQPSLDFVKKIKENFPEYNLDWIIFGKGPMTTSEPFRENIVPADSADLFTPAPEPEPTPKTEMTQSFSRPAEPEMLAGLSQPGVKSLYVIFEDGTFECYTPR